MPAPFKMNVTLPNGKEVLELAEYATREELDAAASAFRQNNGQMWMEIETGDSLLTCYYARYGELMMNIHHADPSTKL